MASNIRPGLPVAALLASIVAVAGCAAPATPSPAPTGVPASASATPEASATPDLRGVVLTVWDGFGPTEAKKAVDEAFTAATGIKLDYLVFPSPFETNVLAKWAAGDRPDILWFHNGGNWVVQLNPEANLRDVSNEPWTATSIESLKNISFKGKHYATILEAPGAFGMLFNKKVIADSGLEVPTTLAELLQFCADLRVKMPDVTPIVAGGADQWMLQIPTGLFLNDFLTENPDFGTQVSEAKATFTDPGFVRAIEATKMVQDAGCFNKDVLTADFADEQKAIMEGTAALDIQGDYMVGILAGAFGGAEKVDETLGFSPLGLNTPGVTVFAPQVLQTFYLPRTGDEKRESAALAYARFIAGQGYQTYLDKKGGFSAFEGYPTPAGVTQIQKDAQRLASEVGVSGWGQDLQAPYGAFEVMSSEMFAGTKTPAEVAQQLQDEFARNARQLGLPGF